MIRSNLNKGKQKGFCLVLSFCSPRLIIIIFPSRIVQHQQGDQRKCEADVRACDFLILHLLSLSLLPHLLVFFFFLFSLVWSPLLPARPPQARVLFTYIKKRLNLEKRERKKTHLSLSK